MAQSSYQSGSRSAESRSTDVGASWAAEGTPSTWSSADSSKEPRRERASAGAPRRVSSLSVLPAKPLSPPAPVQLPLQSAAIEPQQRLQDNDERSISALTNDHFCHR